VSLLRRLERENLDVPSLEQRAANLLGAFALAVHDGLEESLRVGPRPLSLNAVAALRAVRNLPAIKIRDLRLALGITHSACVRIVDQLERMSLLRRSRDTYDRRGTRLEVTSEGEQRARAFERARSDFTEALAKRIPPYWLHRMARVLEVLLSIMTPDAGTALRTCRHCQWNVCRTDPGAPCPVIRAAILREATAEAEERRASQVPWWREVGPPEERSPLPELDIRPRQAGPSLHETWRLVRLARDAEGPGHRQGRRRRW